MARQADETGTSPLKDQMPAIALMPRPYSTNELLRP
jgi:hypothetical protein